jgi:hypothetical protein
MKKLLCAGMLSFLMFCNNTKGPGRQEISKETRSNACGFTCIGKLNEQASVDDK